MQYQKYDRNLRNILLSNYAIQAAAQVPQVVQLKIRVISELKQDVIVNSLLSLSLVPNLLHLSVQNLKKVQLKTSVVVNANQAMHLLYTQLSSLFQQAVDKVVVPNYANESNQVVFTFKGLDILSGPLRQLWKLLEVELGTINLELTIVTNKPVALYNEALFRLYRLPVVFEN
jgi:hypothetical protein